MIATGPFIRTAQPVAAHAASVDVRRPSRKHPIANVTSAVTGTSVNPCLAYSTNRNVVARATAAMRPARALTNRQMQTLQTYVRDLGGGLVAVGGPTSYGVGGYYGTPIEDALPVEMQIKDEQRRPSLAIVFSIDHSGSMSDSSGGATKLEIAKEAAARSIELLFPTDRVGVVAFDDVASWVVPMTDMENPEAVNAALTQFVERNT